MSAHERTGIRCSVYSLWHRKQYGKELKVIDIDWVECCSYCNKPLALVEVTRDVGQYKPTTITCKLAEMAGVEAWLVYYIPKGRDELERVRVQKVFPRPPSKVWIGTPQGWANRLLKMRQAHYPHCTKYPKPKRNVANRS